VALPPSAAPAPSAAAPKAKPPPAKAAPAAPPAAAAPAAERPRPPPSGAKDEPPREKARTPARDAAGAGRHFESDAKRVTAAAPGRATPKPERGGSAGAQAETAAAARSHGAGGVARVSGPSEADRQRAAAARMAIEAEVVGDAWAVYARKAAAGETAALSAGDEGAFWDSVIEQLRQACAPAAPAAAVQLAAQCMAVVEERCALPATALTDVADTPALIGALVEVLAAARGGGSAWAALVPAALRVIGRFAPHLSSAAAPSVGAFFSELRKLLAPIAAGDAAAAAMQCEALRAVAELLRAMSADAAAWRAAYEAFLESGALGDLLALLGRALPAGSSSDAAPSPASAQLALLVTSALDGALGGGGPVGVLFPFRTAPAERGLRRFPTRPDVLDLRIDR
jgi:hypothetical protein